MNRQQIKIYIFYYLNFEPGVGFYLFEMKKHKFFLLLIQKKVRTPKFAKVLFHKHNYQKYLRSNYKLNKEKESKLQLPRNRKKDDIK